MSGERSGLNAIELAVLEALDEVDAGADRQHRKSANVVAHVYESRRIGPRVSYETICALAAPWLVHLQLIDFHGNLGGPDETDAPAGPRYTEIRLSNVGALAVAAERGDVPKLPIGLINGDLNAGGTSPPFAPEAVVQAVMYAAEDPAVSDRVLSELVGPPQFPTGCSVDGDVAALVAGLPSRLRLSAHVTVETSGRDNHLVITRLPFGVGPSAVGTSLASRANAYRGALRDNHPDLGVRLGLPLRDIRDESKGDAIRIVCLVEDDADPETCRRQILETWPVTIEITAHLPTPLSVLVRDQLDDSTHAQTTALRALLS